MTPSARKCGAVVTLRPAPICLAKRLARTGSNALSDRQAISGLRLLQVSLAITDILGIVANYRFRGCATLRMEEPSNLRHRSRELGLIQPGVRPARSEQ
jgi:hypothetical protein